MKSFLWASLIESGRYDPNVEVQSKVYYMGIENGLPTYLPTRSGAYATITNYAHIDHGIVNLDVSFNKSLNTTVGIILSNYLKPSEYISTLDKMSLFKNLNVYGLRSVDGHKLDRYPIEMISMGFGQGSTITPLNMISAYQSILNQGQHIQPSIVKQIVDSTSGEVLYNNTPTLLNKVFSEATSEKMRHLLRSAVTDGTGRHYQIAETEIIAKTGTAEVPSAEGGYANDEYYYSIMAALPYDNPQYLVYYGFTAKDAVKPHQNVDAQKALLRKVAVSMNITEDQSSNETSVIHIPSFVNKSVAQYQFFAQENQLKTLILGDGNQITHLSIAPNSKVLSSSLILAQTNGPITKMPYVIGLSVNEARHLARFASLDIEIIGEGIIVDSNIPFNDPIDKKIILTALKP